MKMQNDEKKIILIVLSCVAVGIIILAITIFLPIIYNIGKIAGWKSLNKNNTNSTEQITTQTIIIEE
jgi:hypothetical protein